MLKKGKVGGKGMKRDGRREGENGNKRRVVGRTDFRVEGYVSLASCWWFGENSASGFGLRTGARDLSIQKDGRGGNDSGGWVVKGM